MLTIKHIDQHGGETLIQCHRFNRERRSDGFTQYMAFAENPLPNDYIATWCGDEEQRTSSLVNRQTIYVMNQHGTTVATYHFQQPDFGRNSGCTSAQADPDLVAAARLAEDA